MKNFNHLQVGWRLLSLMPLVQLHLDVLEYLDEGGVEAVEFLIL